ncbi:MAG: DUF5123 domain-containing protein [Prevotella sp.]|nr:DUF5123 domain-containing protein [Prevotella sp.]
MNKFKYIALSALTVVAGMTVSCTDGNDWEVDGSKAQVLQTKIPSVSNVTGEAALQITVQAFGCTTVEYQASTSEDFTKNLASATVNALSCKLTDLKGYENYYVRVRGLKEGKAPSVWMYYASGDAEGKLKTIMTKGIQLINDIPSTDITTNSIKISWVTEKDGVTYYPVKVSATYSNGEEQVVNEYILSDAEISAKSAILDGLLNSTKYEIRLLQDYGDGTYNCVGFQEVKTQMAPPQADATLTLTTETELTQAMIDQLAADAVAARGSSDDYEGTIIIPAGASITVQDGNNAIKVPGGMTLNFFGGGEETTRPTLIFPHELNIEGKHTAIRFKNVILLGSDNRQNQLYVINQKTVTNTSIVEFSSCTLKNFGRSIIRMSGSSGVISNVVVDDCIFQDLGFGDYGIFQTEKTDCKIETIEVTNSTFDTCRDFIIRGKEATTGIFSSIKFSDCTFYNCINDSKYMIDLTTNTESSITMTNIVMGKLFGGGRGIRAKGSKTPDYTTFDGFYQLSDVTWGGQKIDAGATSWPGTFKSKYATEQMYTDPDNHDFTLLHYLDAGDPRWKIADTGEDDDEE